MPNANLEYSKRMDKRSLLRNRYASETRELYYNIIIYGKICVYYIVTRTRIVCPTRKLWDAALACQCTVVVGPAMVQVGNV